MSLDASAPAPEPAFAPAADFGEIDAGGERGAQGIDGGGADTAEDDAGRGEEHRQGGGFGDAGEAVEDGGSLGDGERIGEMRRDIEQRGGGDRGAGGDDSDDEARFGQDGAQAAGEGRIDIADENGRSAVNGLDGDFERDAEALGDGSGESGNTGSGESLPPPAPQYRHPKKKWRLKRGATPQWYKQRNGVRTKAQSGAARVARHRPRPLATPR